MKRLACIVTLFLAFLVAGCGSSYQNAYVSTQAAVNSGKSVAVLPLVNLTQHPQAGRNVSDLLTTELYASGKFTILERTALIEKIIGDETDLDFVMNTAVAQRVGKAVGADTVVFGSVTEYRYTRGLDQNPAVGVNLRMLDVASGEVTWASSASRTRGWWVSLNQTAQEVCHAMVADLVKLSASGK